MVEKKEKELSMVIKIPRRLSLDHIFRLAIVYHNLPVWDRIKISYSYNNGKKLKKLKPLLNQSELDYDPVFVDWVSSNYSFTDREFNTQSVLMYYDDWCTSGKKYTNYIVDEINRKLMEAGENINPVSIFISAISNAIDLNRGRVSEYLLPVSCSVLKDYSRLEKV